jgi:hypothetical protein
MKFELEKFNPNDKKFGEDLLKYFQRFLSKNITLPIKIGWIKNEKLPVITITKSMDEIQKLYQKKIVSFDFNIWSNNKEIRDSISAKIFNMMKNIEFGKLEVNLSEPQILNFDEKHGIYRRQFNLTIHAKIKINKKDLEIEKLKEQNRNALNKLVFQGSGILTDFIESKNNYFLVRGKKMNHIDSVALIYTNKIIWKKDFDNIVSFAFANDGSYCIAVAQLREKEMPLGYKSGGHIYIITKEGKVKDIKIPCDGLSCSISPDGKNFGITTMGPEWGVYYLDNKGKLIWKKIFDERIGGIELTNSQIVLYDKMHKETRKKVVELGKNGEIKKYRK